MRLLKQGAWDRISVYLGGAAATLVVAVSVGGEFLAPGIVLFFYLALMAVRACVHLFDINKQNKELTLDHTSLRSYLRKASRDRQENRVSIAIQNRKAAASLLESESGTLADDDQRLLQEKSAVLGPTHFAGKRDARQPSGWGHLV